MATVPLIDLTGQGRPNLQIDPREVDIADADAADPAPAIATHGFGAVPFAADPPEGDGDRQYRDYFARLCGDALREATGAPIAFGVPGTVQIRRSTGAVKDGPISVTHSDFTPFIATLRATEILNHLSPKGKVPKVRRYAAYNAWWLAREGPQDRPLALCDASSVRPPDMQVGQTRMLAPNDSSLYEAQIAVQRYGAHQRWYFYPQLKPDRLLLFCGFDSDPRQYSMVAHSSFTNPECPADAPPRVSLECRCFAFW